MSNGKSNAFMDAYLDKVYRFQGNLSSMANSIDLVLGSTLEKMGIKPPTLLGTKIKKFEANKNILSKKYSGEIDTLISKFRSFNTDWNISKHGIIAGGLDIRDPTFMKNGKFHSYDQKTQEDIKKDFSKTMDSLTEIYQKL